MEAHTLRAAIRVVALLLPIASLGCSLLAPSDEELMGGLAKENDAGKDAAEAGGNDAGERDASCGATNATCSVGGDCCSGKCRGNGVCL